MISVYSRAALGQQLELGGALGHDLARSLVQPVEACIEAGISAGGVAREREMTVEPRRDALGLAVQTEEQQLSRGLCQMEQREDVEAHARLVGRVHRSEEHRLTHGALFANRRDDLHRVLETRGASSAENVRPELDDAAKQVEIPALGVLGRGEEDSLVGAKPIAELCLLMCELRETSQQQRAIQRGRPFVRLERERGGQDESSIGAGFNVRRALGLLFAGQDGGGRRGAVEIEPLRRRDDVRPGQRHHEVGGRLRFGRRVTTAQPRENPHPVLNGGRTVLGSDDLDRPMAIQGFERTLSGHDALATVGQGGTASPSHPSLTGLRTISNNSRLSEPTQVTTTVAVAPGTRSPTTPRASSHLHVVAGGRMR